MPVSRIFATAAFLAIASACAAQSPAPAVSSPPPAAASAARPSLVVLVVIDQLAAPLLQRYNDLYKGGFRRLLDQGRVYMNASHNHAATVTAPGHAALSTGVHPSRNGIVGNAWYEKTGQRWVPLSNVGDASVKIVGYPELPGVSPRNLVRPGLGDWVIAANPRSQVASVSGKDRGAILPATRAKGQVYWFEGAVGQFVTSTYYRNEYPAWARDFNLSRVPAFRADSVWRLQVPPSLFGRAKPDTVDAESDGTHTFFPHAASAEAPPERFWEWFESTPMSDVATLEFAKTMVSSLGLGRDDAPDYLNVSLSATDIVGHIYGPSSREQLDNLLRLDAGLGNFFDYLDTTVGRGKWAVALTADHGVVEMPEDLIARGEYGHRLTESERVALADIRARADSAGATPAARAAAVATLKRLDFVADAWTNEQLMAATRDSFALLTRRSIYPGRAGSEFARIGIEVRNKAGFLALPRGSSHGAPYWYDRNVPMIFMGPGIAPGRDAAFVYSVDMAPTLARLMGVPFPADLDGKPIPAVTAR